MKVAIIGANGQLGSDLVRSFERRHQVVPLTHQHIEISNTTRVNELFEELRPDVIINTAAFHQVPLCEQEPQQAFAINAESVLHLAKCALRLQAKFIHFSTDYVFDGQKKEPYLERDCCNPLNVYGASKLAGEHFALNYAEQSFVIRISGIYGATPCRAKGGNFVTTMLKLAKEKPVVRVISDEILTPTPTLAIAANTLELLETNKFGLYHMTSQGQCSWYEFACAIWDILGLKTPLLPSSVFDPPAGIRRPSYSVLDNNMLQQNGIDLMPHWKTALQDFLKLHA